MSLGGGGGGGGGGVGGFINFIPAPAVEGGGIYITHSVAFN